jgi:hypothetical protein
MARPARLITPRGKVIELPPEIYKEVRRILDLATPTRRRSKAEMAEIIRRTYGKFADGPSLTQALLEERAAEHAREEAKLARLHS